LNARRLTVFEGKFEPEPLKSHVPILGLTAAFRSLGVNPRRPVNEHNGGLDLVSMLTAGTTTTGTQLVALLGQLRNRKGRGVHGNRLLGREIADSQYPPDNFVSFRATIWATASRRLAQFGA